MRYLSSDPRRVEQWQQRLGAHTKPRIGLTWSGKQAPGTNRERHFASGLLLPYLPDSCQYFCLQTDIQAEDAQTLAQNPAIQYFQDAGFFRNRGAV